MRRRIIWKYGDSSPIYGRLIAAVEGDGELRVVVGFPVSAAEVAFSISMEQWFTDPYGYGYGSDLVAEAYVGSVDDEGFTIIYKNIPGSLEINYYCV